MGDKLDEIYEIVIKKAGNKGRLRLAVKTGIPRVKAVQEKDTPELIDTFKKAASEILGKDIDKLS